MGINSTLAEIASDLRHAARFDDFEPQQIDFLNSIADRIDAAGTRSFPLSHWAFEEIAPGELRVTFPDLVSAVVRQSAGDRGEPIEFALYMLGSSLLRRDVFIPPGWNISRVIMGLGDERMLVAPSGNSITVADRGGLAERVLFELADSLLEGARP